MSWVYEVFACIVTYMMHCSCTIYLCVGYVYGSEWFFWYWPWNVGQSKTYMGTFYDLWNFWNKWVKLTIPIENVHLIKYSALYNFVAEGPTFSVWEPFCRVLENQNLKEKNVHKSVSHKTSQIYSHLPELKPKLENLPSSCITYVYILKWFKHLTYMESIDTVCVVLSLL